MNTTNKIKYLGFDDKWFMIVGIFLLAMVTTLLFNSRFDSLINFSINYSVSLLFTIANWVTMRFIMIRLRKLIPDIKDSLKRNLIYFCLILLVVISINIIGDFLLKLAFGPSYGSLSVTAFIVVVLISIMTMSIYEAIYYFGKLKQFIIQEEQTRQIITESKLDALRNQARPHFLFNSLNTLKDIIDNEPKNEAKLFVDHLSDVYRFILDTGQANTIPLKEEIAFAKAYLHIQTERFGENLVIDWKISDESLEKNIIPMSVQLLLENAIKHNIISRKKPLKIDIYTANNSIIVTNNLQLKKTALYSTKLGLSNIQKRYEIIGDRKAEISQTDSVFSVSLPIGLN